MKKAMVAIDLSSISVKLAEFAFCYAKKVGVDQLDFIHVMEYHDLQESFQRGLSEEYGQEKVKKDVMDMIRRSAQKTECSSIGHKLYIKTGNPPEVIISVAEKENYHMLLIGNRGMTNLERFFLGSVAAKVVSQAPCDVFVHKPTQD